MEPLTAPINRDLFSWGTVGLDFGKLNHQVVY
jgi:hypothetical protein